MTPTSVNIEISGSNVARTVRSSASKIHVSACFRELIQNSIEAEAQNVHIVPSVMPSTSRRGAKIVFTDDGHGMTPEHMRDYIGTLGRGVSDARGNYHMGSRIATLGISGGMGVVFASWTKETPKGAFLILRMDANGLTYESPLSKIDGEVAGVPAQWSFLKSDLIKKAKQGTSVMLLGNTEEDDTWGFQQNSGGKITPGIGQPPAGWLGLKFFDPRVGGTSVRPTVRLALGAEKGKAWLPPAPTSNPDKARTIAYASDVLANAGTVNSSHSDFIDIRGVQAVHDGSGQHVANVHYIVGKNVRAEQMKYTIAFQSFGEMFEGEVYNLRYPFQNDNSGMEVTKTEAMFRHYGIHDASLRKRLILIVEPVRGTSVPNTERTHLEYTPANGPHRDTLPHSLWGTTFIENMPSELADLQDLAARAATRDHEVKKAQDEHLFRASLYGPHVVSRSGRTMRGTATNGTGAGGSSPKPPNTPRGPANKGKGSASPSKPKGAGGTATVHVTPGAAGKSFTVKDVEGMLVDPPSVELSSSSESNRAMFAKGGEAYGLTVYSAAGTVVVDDLAAWIDIACGQIAAQATGKVTSVDTELIRAALVNLTVDDLRSYLGDIAYRVAEMVGPRCVKNDDKYETLWNSLVSDTILDIHVRSTSRMERLVSRTAWRNYGVTRTAQSDPDEE